MAQTEIDTIRATVSILNSVDYKRYSDGKASTYLEYVSGGWADERKLIAPILFPKLLEQILGFTLGETVGVEEAVAGGRTPDFVPADTRTHPFLFDCKGMDTADLSKWHGQIKSYIEMEDLKYGILVNMRDLGVYTCESSEPIESFSFSFVELHRDFEGNRTGVLESQNTRRFLRFVQSFQYTPLTIEQKLRRVAEAKQWTGSELLNIDLLTRRLHYVVERIYDDVRSRREELLFLKEHEPERAIAIAQEVEMIASEIERGREMEVVTLQTFCQILDAQPPSVLGRALDLFFFRIGYFAMTKLLLARAWEDIGFVDQTLYDGGLARWYESFNREIRRVLKYAFQLAAERYRWLFNVDNNYTWYEPSDETLIETLYELSNFHLGKLDQDVLGSIYEAYIDKVDKKQKGQYYTPREIVEFIWNRVGFTRDEDFFAYREGMRKPRLIFDPATGSGGFLVEAVRRMREESRIDSNDFDDLLDLRTCILTGVFGSEISRFPYYITEVNLLIQLTPTIKRMMEMKKGVVAKGTPAMGVIPVDALSLYNPEQLALEPEDCNFDQTRDLLPVESQKQVMYQKIKKICDGEFSYCCANPPYVGEKGNKELFRATLARFPYWRNFYQGKMDYLYFFIVLGLSKLQEGGKLGFITTDYWPTADGASKLRTYILENAKIREMIFFQDVKVFEHAKGQHNMVFTLEKCSAGRRAERDDNRIKIVRVVAGPQDLQGDTIREKLRLLTRHIEEHIDRDKWQDEYIQVFLNTAEQGALSHKAWHFTQSGEAQKIQGKISRQGFPLGDICGVSQGILSGADRVSSKNIKLIPQELLSRHNIRVGDGIFVLNEGELNALNLSDEERALVKPFCKNSDIDRYYVNRSSENPRFIIYTTNDTDIHKYPAIRAHLEKFRPILENRLSTYGEDYPWYRLHREREQTIFDTEKLVTPNRAPRNTFAFDSTPLYAMSDVFFVGCPTQGIRLAYVLAILNSTLMDFWFSETRKAKGEAREYVGTPLSRIPIRRIDFDDPKDVRLHDDIVERVTKIRSKMGELAAYSRYSRGTRLTRLKDKDPLPDLDLESIAECLSPENRFSLRTHPGIEVEHEQDLEKPQFVLSRVGEVSVTSGEAELRLHGKGRRAVTLTGDKDLLKTIGDILTNHEGVLWSSIRDMPIVPKDHNEFERKKQHIVEAVSGLRQELQMLQESVDAIVCKLYGLTEEEIALVEEASER